MRQAKAGGEIGKNGEFYKGGQFLPSSENTIKGAQKTQPPTGKQLIAPYVWEVAPEDGLLAIYARIEHSSRITNRSECEYVKGEGLVGAILEYSPSTRLRAKIYENKDDIPKECVPYKATNHSGKARHKIEWYAIVPETGDYVREEKAGNPKLDAFFSGLVDKWNAGERWIAVVDDPYHWSNNQ